MRVKVGDVHLYFDVEGAKLRPDGPAMREVPTVLLLHGGPGFDHSIFKPAFSSLADIAQVVYLDHRGNGRSDRDARAHWTLDRWADDVRAFCGALEIERPIVVGESFGGMVAIAYATRHPDHPAKLVLASTAAKMREDRSLDMFERLGGAQARAVAQRFFENPTPQAMAEYVERCLPLYTRTPVGPEMMTRSVMNQELTAFFFSGEICNFDLLPALARIKCPTLITVGELDPITPLANAEDIAKAIPAGLVRFERFPDAGHGVHRDAPERFFRVLREFIAS
jgi:proline-specific peptidase